MPGVRRVAPSGRAAQVRRKWSSRCLRVRRLRSVPPTSTNSGGVSWRCLTLEYEGDGNSARVKPLRPALVRGGTRCESRDRASLDECHKQALQIIKVRLGNDHPDVATSCQVVAAIICTVSRVRLRRRLRCQQIYQVRQEAGDDDLPASIAGTSHNDGETFVVFNTPTSRTAWVE